MTFQSWIIHRISVSVPSPASRVFEIYLPLPRTGCLRQCRPYQIKSFWKFTGFEALSQNWNCFPWGVCLIIWLMAWLCSCPVRKTIINFNKQSLNGYKKEAMSFVQSSRAQDCKQFCLATASITTVVFRDGLWWFLGSWNSVENKNLKIWFCWRVQLRNSRQEITVKQKGLIFAK